MNLKIKILIIFAFWANIIFSQSGEITVNGNSNITLYPKAVMINILVSDVQPNEYKKTRYKKLDIVFQEFKDNLISKGVIVKLEKDNKFYSNSSYYNNGGTAFESENYTARLKDETEAILFKKSLTEGVTMSNVLYIYDPFSVSMKNDMVDKAIENAKENANYLAKKLNRKLGAIKSIVSQNYNDINSNERMERQTTYSHSLTISFELL